MNIPIKREKKTMRRYRIGKRHKCKDIISELHICESRFSFEFCDNAQDLAVFEKLVNNYQRQNMINTDVVGVEIKSWYCSR